MDLEDIVTQNSKFLILTETWIDNKEIIRIKNFKLCSQYKKKYTTSGEVAIYMNQKLMKHEVEITNTYQNILDEDLEKEMINSIGDGIAIKINISRRRAIY